VTLAAAAGEIDDLDGTLEFLNEEAGAKDHEARVAFRKVLAERLQSDDHHRAAAAVLAR
jgi:hypothetical protein